MNPITPEMVAEFNQILMDQNSILQIVKDKGNDYSYLIQIPEDRYIEIVNVYPNKEFYTLLEHFFTSEGIKLTYNNTKQIFWVD